MHHGTLGFFALLLTIGGGCAGGVPERAIDGHVILSGVDDASGVLVTLAGPMSANPQEFTRTQVANTEVDGRFTFADVNPGTYVLSATVADSQQQRIEVLVTKEQVGVTVPPITFTLVATVTGTVTREGATDHTGTMVSISNGQGSVLTDATGAFAIANVPVGMRAITAAYPPFAPATAAVQVTRGSATVPPLVLAAVPPPANGTITGHVTFPAADDLTFTTIHAVGAPSDVTDAPVQADGTFSISLPPGTYALVANTPYHSPSDLGVHESKSGATRDIGTQVLQPFMWRRSLDALSASPLSSSSGDKYRPTPKGRFVGYFSGFSAPYTAVVDATQGTIRPFWVSTAGAVQQAIDAFGNGEQLLVKIPSPSMTYAVLDQGTATLTPVYFGGSPVNEADLQISKSGTRAGGVMNHTPPTLRMSHIGSGVVVERALVNHNQTAILKQGQTLLLRRGGTISTVDIESATLDDVPGSAIAGAIDETVKTAPIGTDQVAAAAYGPSGSRRLSIFLPSGQRVETNPLTKLATVNDVNPINADGRWLRCTENRCVATDALLVRTSDAAVVTAPSGYATSQALLNPSATRIAYRLPSNTCVEDLTPGTTLDCSAGANEQIAGTIASTSDHGWLTDGRWMGYDAGAETLFEKVGNAAAVTRNSVIGFASGVGVAVWTDAKGTGTPSDDSLVVAYDNEAPVTVVWPGARHIGFTGTNFASSPDKRWRYVSGLDSFTFSFFSIQIDTQQHTMKVLESMRTTQQATNATVGAYLTASPTEPVFADILYVHTTGQRMSVQGMGSSAYSDFPATTGPRTFFYWLTAPPAGIFSFGLQP